MFDLKSISVTVPNALPPKKQAEDACDPIFTPFLCPGKETTTEISFM
jgi:hypothetical protein